MLGILTVIFVIGKILGIGVIATWSWWLVLSPMLIGFVIAIAIMLAMGIIAYLATK